MYCFSTTEYCLSVCIYLLKRLIFIKAILVYTVIGFGVFHVCNQCDNVLFKYFNLIWVITKLLVPFRFRKFLRFGPPQFSRFGIINEGTKITSWLITSDMWNDNKIVQWDKFLYFRNIHIFIVISITSN